jgi:hypothetical protein
MFIKACHLCNIQYDPYPFAEFPDWFVHNLVHRWKDKQPVYPHFPIKEARKEWKLRQAMRRAARERRP